MSPHLRPVSPRLLGMSVPVKRPTCSGRTRCFLRGGGLGPGPFTGHAVPTLWGDSECQSTRARGPTGPPNPDTQHTHTVPQQPTRASPVGAGPCQGVQSTGRGAWPLSHPPSPDCHLSCRDHPFWGRVFPHHPAGLRPLPRSAPRPASPGADCVAWVPALFTSSSGTGMREDG